MTGRRLRPCVVVAALAAVTLALAACGGDDGGSSDGAAGTVGYTRDPAPRVDGIPLPDMSQGGAPFAVTAPADGVLLVYFGFTNCPDVCPTTLSNVRSALAELGDDAARVEVAMVTVDPDRDTDVVAEYVDSFVAGAHALATDDAVALQALADVFGVSYVVTTRPDGEVEVGHSNYLFAVDDTGRLALTWPADVTRDDLVREVRSLLTG